VIAGIFTSRSGHTQMVIGNIDPSC